MSTRAAAWLAWTTCALALVLVGLAFGLVLLLKLSHPGEAAYAYWIHSTAIAVSFSTVGAIIASHRPRHWVGWLFCMIGLLVAADHFCGEYAIYVLRPHPEALPAGEAAAWIHSWMWIVSGGLGVFLVLLFPEGRLTSVHWRYLAWINVVVTFDLDMIGPRKLSELSLHGLGKRSAKITRLEVFWAAPRRSEGQGNPTYELGERVYALCFRWLPE